MSGSTLSDIIAQATSQITNNANGQKNQISNGLSNALTAAKASVANGISNSVNAGLNTGVSDAVNAAAAAFSGNPSGALSILGNLPGDVIDSASSSFSLGGYNALSGAQALVDPLLNFMWYAQMPTLSASPTADSNSNSSSASSLFQLAQPLIVNVTGSGSANVINLPWYYVEKANLPFRNFSTSEIFRNGSHSKFLRDYSVGDMTLDFYLDTNNQAMSYLMQWDTLKTSTNNNRIGAGKGNTATVGNIGLAANYKKDITFYILSPNNQTVVTIQYVGCFPTNLGNFSLEGGSSDRIVANVTFSVDDVFIKTTMLTSSLVNSVLGGTMNINAAIGATLSGLGSSALTGASQLYSGLTSDSGDNLLGGSL